MEALKTYRKLAGISQAELARRCDCSQPTISDIENGKLWPTRELLERLTKVTGFSADRLLSN